LPLNRGEIGFLSCEDPETAYRIRALSKIRLSRGCAHSHKAAKPQSREAAQRWTLTAQTGDRVRVFWYIRGYEKSGTIFRGVSG